MLRKEQKALILSSNLIKVQLNAFNDFQVGISCEMQCVIEIVDIFVVLGNVCRFMAKGCRNCKRLSQLMLCKFFKFREIFAKVALTKVLQI